MKQAVRDQYERFPDPSPSVVPITPRQLDRLDDSLHYGWSWQRYRYCYRKSDGLRILDAGCGTGLSTLGLAKLNPSSTVLGIDASEPSLGMARERAKAAGLPGVEFREHNLDQPIPGGWGPFDFIACRKVLGQVEDPVQVLKNLAAALDRRGLLLATFPSRLGRQPALALRMAVEAIAGPEVDLAGRAALGLDLLRALRADHPIRTFDIARHGPAGPTAEQFVATYLNESERDFTLSEAIGLVEQAGLQFLVAPARAPWRADQVLTGHASPALRAKVAELPDSRMGALTDALNPSLHGDEYRIYACPADFEPRLPTWPESIGTAPEIFDPLIPHLTGLATPARDADDPGKVLYRLAGGGFGELIRRSHEALALVDGRRTCGEIDGLLAEASGVEDDRPARRDRWLELANFGFIMLESTESREHLDCQHLGPVLDRLDCACPRRWVRACDLHGHCTIAHVGPQDERRGALDAAIDRHSLKKIVACADCADYTPDE